MDFLSAITPQIAVLGLGALVLLVLTFVLVSLALRGWAATRANRARYRLPA